MENETLQCRSTATNKNMGVNSCSQLVSAFRTQSDFTENNLTILPVLQDPFSITRERHTVELKHSLYDEQLSNLSSNTTMNWDMEANYISPSVVHHSSNNNYIHLNECVLQTTPPTTTTTIIQHPQTTKLNNDLQQFVNDEIRQDGIMNTTQQQTISSIGTTKQNFTNFANTDLNGSKVIRLVRAKQATKRKSSLDTLIEVVQKELLRVNGQSNSTSPSSSPPHYSQTRSTTSSTSSKQTLQQQHHSMISSVLPSSHPGSLTSQSNQSYKIARKRGNHHLNNTKRIPSNRHRNKSFNNNNNNNNTDDLIDDIDLMDDDNNNNHHLEQQQQLNECIDEIQSSTENIEEIVRDTVDKLVAITLLNNAPFIVNMLTAIPTGNSTNTNIESKPLTNNINTNSTSTLKPLSTASSSSSSNDYHRNDLALLSSTASDIRNSMQQTSPIKQQQIILQPTSSSTIQGNSSFISTDSTKSSTSTLFVTPRILNFQTVVPKPTTNIQIGNTKIILVSPSTNSSSQQQQQQNLVNHSPVKLVKFTPTKSSTLTTLPKNVQIVIPSRTSNESLSTTFRPLTTLTTCSIDQIPQATQEITITTSSSSSSLNNNSTINKPRRRSSTSTPIDKPVGKILRPIAKVLPVYSPNNSNNHTTSSSSTITTNSTHDEIIKPMTVNFQQQQQQLQRPSSSTHGPMIYRMTSVNPNVPVFRVRATTAPTSSTIKTDVKSISVTNPTSMSYEPKQTHKTTTTSGSVSVLACFKTTKKRNKERAIMPRPSTTDSIDTSHDLQQRLTTTTNNSSSTSNTNVPLIINNHNITNDLINSNSSLDYRQQSITTLPSTHLIQQHSLPTRLSSNNNKTTSNVLLFSMPQHKDSTISSNDLNISSSNNNIPIYRSNSIKLNNNPSLIKTITTPLISPIQLLHSTSNIRPLMEDKCIQCINNKEEDEEEDEEEVNENSIEYDEQITTNHLVKKRNGQSYDESNENWTVAADTLLRNVLSQYGFRFLDVNCQQNLSSKFDTIQANLVSGMISSTDEFYKLVLDIKENLLKNGLSKISADNLEKLFNYFELEYPKIRDGDSFIRTNDRKRTRRQ